MYRVKLTTGSETVFESFAEFAKAVATGTVTRDASIWHDRARKWLPVSVHPAYKRALDAGVIPGSQAPPPKPPSQTTPPPAPPPMATPEPPKPEPEEPVARLNTDDLRHLLDIDSITTDMPAVEDDATPTARAPDAETGAALSTLDDLQPVPDSLESPPAASVVEEVVAEATPGKDVESVETLKPAEDLPRLADESSKEPPTEAPAASEPVPSIKEFLASDDFMVSTLDVLAAEAKEATAPEPEPGPPEDEVREGPTPVTPTDEAGIEPEEPSGEPDDRMEIALSDSMLDLKAMPENIEPGFESEPVAAADSAPEPEPVEADEPQEEVSGASLEIPKTESEPVDESPDEAVAALTETPKPIPVPEDEPEVDETPGAPTEATATGGPIEEPVPEADAAEEPESVEALQPETEEAAAEEHEEELVPELASTEVSDLAEDWSDEGEAQRDASEPAEKEAAPQYSEAPIRTSITARSAPVLGESYRRRQMGLPTWAIGAFVVVALIVLGWFGRGILFGPSGDGNGAPAGTETPDPGATGGTPDASVTGDTPDAGAAAAVPDTQATAPLDSAALLAQEIQAYQDGYGVARTRLRSTISSISFGGLLASSRLGDVDSLRVARNTVQTALTALQTYRARELELENLRPDGQPSLQESETDAERADLFLEGMASLVDFLIQQTGQYRLLAGAVLFQDSTVQAQYNLRREVVLQQLSLAATPPASISRLVATTDSVPVPESTFIAPINVPGVTPLDTAPADTTPPIPADTIRPDSVPPASTPPDTLSGPNR